MPDSTTTESAEGYGLGLEDILDLPGFFYCERTRCRLKISACVGRQEANAQRKGFESMPFWVCEKCKQGEENMTLGAVDSGLVKPRRGRGQRSEGCPFYSRCLDWAAKRDWKTWNCVGCRVMTKEEPEMQRVESTEKTPHRICEVCNEKPAISPNARICASCMAKRGSEKRKAAKLAEDAPSGGGAGEKAKPPCHPQDRGRIVDPEPDLEVVIRFKGFPHILSGIRAAAEREFRPVDLQILYLLSRSLDGERGPEPGAVQAWPGGVGIVTKGAGQ